MCFLETSMFHTRTENGQVFHGKLTLVIEIKFLCPMIDSFLSRDRWLHFPFANDQAGKKGFLRLPSKVDPRPEEV